MIVVDMKRNRHPKPRPPFGERLTSARIRAGLTQAELGEKLGMSQRGVASWERGENSSPNPEQLALLARLLDVSIEELVNGDANKIRRKPGPKGKLLKLFHDVSDLPRTQQKDVVDVLEMYVGAKKKQLAGKEAAET